MNQQEFRSQILFEHGATLMVAQELLAYNQNKFSRSPPSQASLLPAPHLVAWEQYLAEGELAGAFYALKKRLVQLHFPIASGISKSDGYRTAVSQGIFPREQTNQGGLVLNCPEQVSLSIQPTLAGSIPVIQVENHQDFARLVQAFVHKNEPVPIPPAMGACIINGYNNWDRIQTWRQSWEAEHDHTPTNHEWAVEFQLNIKPFRHLYQDTFILLSCGAYSHVSAAEIGVSANKWLDCSHRIRLAHECTHYATHRLFGSMQNRMIDELIADYWGIRHAIGTYRADWFLRFMGMADYPGMVREDGRLYQYRGDPPLSDAAFDVLQALVYAAAKNLEIIDGLLAKYLKTTTGQRRLLTMLTTFTLEELSHSDAPTRVCERMAV